MDKKAFIGITSLVIALSLTWTLLTPALFPAEDVSGQAAAAHPGFKAPNFTLETLEGENKSLSDYEGQPVLIFLWASWCSVCKATMPGLEEVYEEYTNQGFELLAVNMTTQDTLSSAIAYFQTQDYTFPMLIDADGEVAESYQMHALPTSILVGPDGVVMEVTIGSGMNGNVLRARLDQVFSSQVGE